MIIQAEEWADFHGNSSVTPLSYDGFDVQITTNVVSNSGNALTATGVTIPAFDKIIKRIRLQGGNTLHGIYLSYGLQAVVNQIVSTQARYFINVDSLKNNELMAGDNILSYQSPIGPVPIIGDFFCNPSLPYSYNAAGSSGAAGSALSTAYFLRHDAQGVEMADLVPIGRTELANMLNFDEYKVAVSAEPVKW